MPLHVRETGAVFEDSVDGLHEATEHAAEVAVKLGRPVDVVRETSDLDAVIDGWSGYVLPDGIAQAEGATPADFDRADLKVGIVVEMEHTTDPGVALEIAMSHLVEDPDYYEKLARMEAGEAVGYGSRDYLTSADSGPSYPRHAHCARLGSPDADGRTSYDADHDHAIVGGVVQPADDGHDHDLMPDVACPTRASERSNPGRRDLPSNWTDKDVRKYEHIKKAELDAGVIPEDAKRIAAATVNRDRCERGASEWNEAAELRELSEDY